MFDKQQALSGSLLLTEQAVVVAAGADSDKGAFLHLLSLEELFTIGHLVDKIQDVVKLMSSKMFTS